MKYAKIAVPNSGFTNQIFALIGDITTAYINKQKVIIVDGFLDDILKDKYTPVSDIFDIDKMNEYLKNKYDVIIVDKYNINFELTSVLYGIENEKIDLTEHFKNSNNGLFIDKNTNFNDIKGDPCIGIEKSLFLNYKINGYTISEIYGEHLTENISIDFLNSTYNFHYNSWINTYDRKIFDNILLNIHYNLKIIKTSDIIFNGILLIIDSNLKSLFNNNINILHLRLEEDAIKHWAGMNKMSTNKFKYLLEEKYIDIIKKHVNKNTDNNIILSSSFSNGVIDFLEENNYRYFLTPKYFKDREKNAIIDFLISKNCNNLFIGNFNFVHLNGSTFSYYIKTSLKDSVKKFCIDLDKIYDKYVVL